MRLCDPGGAPGAIGLPRNILSQQPLKVLLADPDSSHRASIQSILEQAGHTVVLAEEGLGAISVYMSEQPDLVLLDAQLPKMDGHQVMAHIRELSGDSFVPVLLLAMRADDAQAVDYLARGGNDVLLKASPPAVIQAKLESYAQMRRLYRAVREQRDALAQHNRWLKREYEIAEGVFAKVMHAATLDAPQIKYLVSPQAIFNGDLVLVAHRPSGEMHLLLGDFTGHGLSAAIGTIPVADIFNGMTAKGYSIPEIVAEINQKLLCILPRGIFFAAAMIELDTKNHNLSAWVGGVPDILIYGADEKRMIGRLASRNFPLGIMEPDQLDCHVETVEVARGDRIYLCTDGVSEARNPAGEMFGRARLEQCLNRGLDAASVFEHILLTLEQFRASQRQSDDVTLIEVTVDPALGNVQTAVSAIAPRPPADWRASFEFSCDSLKGHDPLPAMIQVLLETQRLHQHKQRIYMILSELFLNALEHGLLRLDSALKDGPGSFGAYYKEKEQRMAALRSGTIRVDFHHAAQTDGGLLTIRVEDSGPGFDHEARMRQLGQTQAAHGRGLLMIQSCCQFLRYAGAGNIAEAGYRWLYEPGPVEP